MIYLFFDTETTGFGADARLVSIAWQIWNNEKFIKQKYFIIKPENFKIPASATKIHGITTEYALKKGQNLRKIMLEFEKDLRKSDLLIAHNYKYDYRIVFNEMDRLNIKSVLPQKKYFDTMINGQKIFRLPKWPKLSELYFMLMGKDFNNKHNAQADVNATVRIFFELKKRNLLPKI